LASYGDMELHWVSTRSVMNNRAGRMIKK
jgi:hypothetical protein